MQSEDTLIKKRSIHDVNITMDRLASMVEKRGINLVARIDHEAGAQSVGMELRPTQVLIFANPLVGTPLIQQNQLVGLDLPTKVIVWQSDNGSVWLAYRQPLSLLYGPITDPSVSKAIAKMEIAMDEVTNYAVCEDSK